MRKNLASDGQKKIIPGERRIRTGYLKVRIPVFDEYLGCPMAGLVGVGGPARRVEGGRTWGPHSEFSSWLCALCFTSCFGSTADPSGKSLFLVFSFLPCKERGLNDLIC